MEFMSLSMSPYDIDRFGALLPRFTPRQADLLMVIGTVTIVGMAFATFIAIFLVPVLFVLIERLSHRGRRDTAEATPVAPGTVPAPQRVTS